MQRPHYTWKHAIQWQPFFIANQNHAFIVVGTECQFVPIAMEHNFQFSYIYLQRLSAMISFSAESWQNSLKLGSDRTLSVGFVPNERWKFLHFKLNWTVVKLFWWNITKGTCAKNIFTLNRENFRHFLHELILSYFPTDFRLQKMKTGFRRERTESEFCSVPTRY